MLIFHLFKLDVFRDRKNKGQEFSVSLRFLFVAGWMLMIHAKCMFIKSDSIKISSGSGFLHADITVSISPVTVTTYQSVD